MSLIFQPDRLLASTVDFLRRLELQKLPHDWINVIWNSQFTDNPSLDDFHGKCQFTILIYSR